MKVVYTAGPYRNKNGFWYVNRNIQQAEQVALKLWRMGFSVICPHKNTGQFDGALSEDHILAGYLELVPRCDYVVLLPGWQYSAGTCAEYFTAVEHGIPVFEWEKDQDVLARLAMQQA